MKAKYLVAAALIATAASAMAADYQVGGEAYVSFPIPSMSKAKASEQLAAAPAVVAPVAAPVAASSAGKTRAEVIAELAQARAEGQRVGGDSYVAFAPAAPSRVAGEAVQTAGTQQQTISK